MSDVSSAGTARATLGYGTTCGKDVLNAINASLLNPATGTYYLSESDHSTIALDANALSVLFGVAPTGKVPGILSALKALQGPHGSELFSGTTYSNLISPYITAYKVDADYLAGDTADAEHLMHLTWDQMIDPRNRFFTGTMWEKIGPDGTATGPGPAWRTARPPARPRS